MTGHRIAVVGGGLAGISAALAAADRGAEVVLFERRSKLGGLTWSFERRGLWFDNGQHVFMRCCTAYLDFLERIGARDQVTLQARLDVPVLAPGACGRRSAVATCPHRSTWSGPCSATAICRWPSGWVRPGPCCRSAGSIPPIRRSTP